jgi:hypothetical protein
MAGFNILPYQFEPERQRRADDHDDNNGLSQSDEIRDDEMDISVDRLNDISWCGCQHCVILPTQLECLCCSEIENTKTLMDEENIHCITEHSAFAMVCLNRHVLRTALIARRDLRPYSLVEPISNE